VSSDSSTGSSDDPARLLVSKQLLNKYVVESMDVVIKYSVYNVGAVTATDVQLKDASFGPDFLVVGGAPEVNLGRLPPSANATHTLVVRPVKFGYYNFTAAQVTYKSGDESSEVWGLNILISNFFGGRRVVNIFNEWISMFSQVLQGWSSEPGEGYIAPFREFDKRFSPHLVSLLISCKKLR